MSNATVKQLRKGRASDGYGRVFWYDGPKLCALWCGGEYVDLFAPGTRAKDAFSGDASAFDCFNVWNHATEEPTIERTGAAFKAYMDERMSRAHVVSSGYPGEIWVELEAAR